MNEIMSLLSGAGAGCWEDWRLSSGLLVLTSVEKNWQNAGEGGADVAAAQQQTRQAEAITRKQADNIKVAKNVETSNANLNDAAARDKLRQSKYNLDD